MTKKGTKADAIDKDDAQPPLVPLSEDELKKAGKKLAGKIRELEDLEAEHKELREEQKAERTKLKGEIAAIATTIRQQGR